MSLAVLFVCLVLLAFGPALAHADEELTGESDIRSRDIALIAHRGITEEGEPENTLAAFRSASANPTFFGVELDVWESLSETGDVPLLLVNHDEDISSTYNAPQNTNIRTLTRATRATYKNRANGAPLPTMEEALDAIWNASGDTVPVIELKGSTRMPGSNSAGTAEFMSERAITYVVDYVGTHGTEVYLISFSYDTLKTAEQVAHARGYGNIRTMFLDPGIHVLDDDPYEFPRKMAADGIDVASLVCTAITGGDVVSRYHDVGVLVGAYEVPHLVEMERLDGIGVDFVTPSNTLKRSSDCAGNHQWDGGVITKDPTCEEEGVTTYTCSNCGMRQHEAIPPLGHEWGEWEVTMPATTTQTGVETRTCQRDPAHTETREIPLIPEYHALGEGDKVFAKGSGQGLVLFFQRSLYGEQSLGVPTSLEVDGADLENGDYAMGMGEAVVLRPAYLKTLPIGEHALAASFEDGGQATVSFMVADVAVEAEEEAAPAMGTDTIVLVCCILGCVLLLVVVIVVLRQRKRT